MQELTEFNIEKTTAEILILKDQTAQNIIEIGKRLIEVKENLQHGEFSEWLKKRVDISHRTANNFMKVATTFSNSQSIANLGSTKLFLLAGLDEENREEVMQENNIKEMTTRELEQVVKEKKEIKKQLEAEKEYSEELQEAIKEKEIQIRNLQNEIENVSKPEVQVVEKEIIKEVIPENLILEKQSLEDELETLRKRAEKAENTVNRLKLDKEINQDKVYTNIKLDNLLVNITDFLNNASKYTYLKDELQKIPSKNKRIVENKIQEIENWALLMKQALNNEQNVVGNIIFSEGEIINE
jgi:hypothetical protein|nr:MAG TPA: Protein of unknown function (DUF3102) [Caudoviricetes sp.]DAV68406.1 MAG TPA: Protein of unknown function (DUF3102) [Caudoviricetes sp.]